ncbi:MAG: 50S ribosomal protein L18 [Chlamydiae bacterium RIFCSPHIGHO2_12_FULL_27_8]|nr:MAG: 50S ribosomal protein L18 [Chlamydiae bacterium RIFCSPHIGHO2_12_FULL_27_8]OGN64928.1 MAG: 50S ribosomal protein L18 [Chlamydiae bacterium RIFCSPLOWO2_01_FULL_28_7]
MFNNLKKRKISRERRVFRVRKKTKGSESKPRLTIFKSNRHLFAQIIDDENHKTICAAGTSSKKDIKNKSKENAKLLGEKIASMAKTNNIENVVFDRGRYKYHGVIHEFAQGAREAGLKF